MEMQNFLDNTMVFATVIDLVGKYQLDMQSVFAYAPMARSMEPDAASEEAFHIGHGRKSVRTHRGHGRRRQGGLLRQRMCSST